MKGYNTSFEYTILSRNGDNKVYPYIFSQDGDKDMYCLSPIHCRSYVVGRHENGRYIKWQVYCEQR